jgi:hypothetical protein
MAAGAGFGGCSFGLGAGFGAVDCLNMLAQVFCGGAAGFGATGAAVTGASVAAGASDPFLAPQAGDSSVGTDSGWFSLFCVPFVVACAGLLRVLPRPPRSVALPRPRLPPSAPPRAPRAGRAAAESVVVDEKVSGFALVRVRSFFCFETSPH